MLAILFAPFLPFLFSQSKVATVINLSYFDQAMALEDGVPATTGLLRYRGNAPTDFCVSYNANSLEISKCPPQPRSKAEQEIYAYVNYWAIWNMEGSWLLAPFRSVTKDSKKCLASGANENGNVNTRKVGLRYCYDYPSVKSAMFWKIDKSAQEIIVGGLCLYATKGVESTSDSTNGTEWYGNETLVVTNCTMVKGDQKAKFEFTPI